MNEYSVCYFDGYSNINYSWLVDAKTELAAKLICHNKLREDNLIGKGLLQSFLATCTCELVN